jgi:hypothetical protein
LDEKKFCVGACEKKFPVFPPLFFFFFLFFFWNSLLTTTIRQGKKLLIFCAREYDAVNVGDDDGIEGWENSTILDAVLMGMLVMREFGLQKRPT